MAPRPRKAAARTIAVLACSVLFLVSCSSGGQGKPSSKPSAAAANSGTDSISSGPPISITIGGPANTGASLATYVGIQAGFFKQAGIDASFQVLASSAVVAALTSGTIQVANGAFLQTAQLRQTGVAARMISVVFPKNDFAVVSSKKANLGVVGTNGYTVANLGKDLQKQTIAGIPPGTSSIKALLESYFQAAGVAPTYTPLNSPATSDIIAAFSSGTATAALAQIPIALDLKNAGVGKIVSYAAKDSPFGDAAWAGEYTTDAFLNKNPTFGARFAAASAKTIAWCKDPKNRAQYLKYASDFTKAPANSIQEGLFDEQSLLGTTVTRASAQKAIDFAKSAKLIPSNANITVGDLGIPQVYAS